MSLKLKPLLLPQKVRQEKLEEQRERQEQQLLHDAKLARQSPNIPSQEPPATADNDPLGVYYTQNSSSSDVACPSPVTPTFSRSSYSCFSGSSSSLENLSPSCSGSPVSPIQPTYPSAKVAGKRRLPDVQEEPMEKEDDAFVHAPDPTGSYYLLCDDSCEHNRSADLTQSMMQTQMPIDLAYYDVGFQSDNDYMNSPRSPKKRRAGNRSLSAWSSHVGTRFNSLTKWRNPGRDQEPESFYQASEPSFDPRPPFSRATSSRSSSTSAPNRQKPSRVDRAPLPLPPNSLPTSTPGMSLFGSTESFQDQESPHAIDIDDDTVRLGLERDRALATTPLLPPLMTETKTLPHTASVQSSPLQSPTVVESPALDMPIASPLSSPPPSSTKTRFSSFPTNTATVPILSPSDPSAQTPDASVSATPLHINILEQHDEWSDRLGHANFTISPKPYEPEEASMEILRNFRLDWDKAKVNYTRHLVRTGEHYGITSNTYTLTEAKWAEMERQWRLAQANLVDRVSKMSSEAAFATLQWHRPQDDISPGLVPIMLDAQKFPERGDEDIVGPMVRDAVMARDPAAADDRKNIASSQFWKSLAEKLGRKR